MAGENEKRIMEKIMHDAQSWEEADEMMKDVGIAIEERPEDPSVAKYINEIDRYTIEAHGTGYAIYLGRTMHTHGFNIAYVTEPDMPRVVEMLRKANSESEPMRPNVSLDAALDALKTRTMERDTSIERCRELCERESEIVSDEIDPSVNVSWMRGSPGLGDYIRGLELEKCGWERAASMLRTGMGLDDGTDLFECLQLYLKTVKAAQERPDEKKLAKYLMQHGVLKNSDAERMAGEIGTDYVPRSELDAARKTIDQIKAYCFFSGSSDEEIVSHMGKVVDSWRKDLDAAKAEVEKLREALLGFQHDDKCFCEASFGGPSTCHVRHSPECEKAMRALGKEGA